MKSLIAILASAMCLAAVAAESPKHSPTNTAKKGAYLYVTGGKIQRPDSFKGKIAFVNTQTRYDEKALRSVVTWCAENLEYNMVVEKDAPVAEWTWTLGPSMLKKHNAQLAIVFVDNAALPPLLAAPEEGWAVVNVAKLTEGLDLDNLMQQKMFESRCDKEAFRAFSMIGGGACAAAEGVAINAATVKELDALSNDLPFDNINLYKQYLAKRGVTPRIMVLYRQACREGWAPAPTNEYQKAAWDRIHTLPTKPIIIEPESKTQKK